MKGGCSRGHLLLLTLSAAAIGTEQKTRKRNGTQRSLHSCSAPGPVRVVRGNLSLGSGDGAHRLVCRPAVRRAGAGSEPGAPVQSDSVGAPPLEVGVSFVPQPRGCMPRGRENGALRVCGSWPALPLRVSAEAPRLTP